MNWLAAFGLAVAVTAVGVALVWGLTWSVDREREKHERDGLL